MLINMPPNNHAKTKRQSSLKTATVNTTISKIHMPLRQHSTGSNTLYMCNMNVWSDDAMTSFTLHKWPEIPKSGANLAGVMVKGYPHMPLRAYHNGLNMLYMSNMDVEAVWDGYQPQIWCYGIIFTPQVTLSSLIWGKLGRCNGRRMHPYVLETACQWLKHLLYV